MNLLAPHIPDGFLSLQVALTGWILALPAIALAIQQSKSLEERFVPLAGLLSAFVFAAQTLQFPIPGGTSGHLVGASLVTIALGLPMGMVVLFSVLLLEALVFGTGGVLALGWNTFNMMVVMGVSGNAIFHAFRRRGAGTWWSALCSGWLATMWGALVTCMELAAAHTSPLLVSLPAMMTTQAVVGVGEGTVTAAALTLLARARPDLASGKNGDAGSRTALGLASLVTLGALLPPSLYDLPEQPLLWQRHPALLVVLGLFLLTATLLGVTGKLNRR